MKRAALVLVAVLVAACNRPPTAAPTAVPTAEPTLTAKPPTSAPRPTATTFPLPDVPETKVEFEGYLVDNFGVIGDTDLALVDATITDLAPTGSDMLYVEIETLDLVPDGLFEESAGVKREWATRLIDAMDAWAKGRDWNLTVGKSYYETSAANAGQLSAAEDIFVSVSDDYDLDNGGFLVTHRSANLSRRGDDVSAAVYRESQVIP